MAAKTRYALLALAIVFLMPTSSQAQEWSSEEKAVLDNLAECWDIWMEGIRQGSPDRWMTECSTPEMTYWAAADGAPLDNEYNRRNWESSRATDLGWSDIRPVSLKIIDDIAVFHFYGYWRARSADGDTRTEAKRTEIFKRIDGRWKLIAGHATPVTPADATPYRGG